MVPVAAFVLCSPCVAQQRVTPQHAQPYQVTIRHPDGTVEVRRPDGTITTTNPRGDQGAVFYPNGTQQGYLIAPDGQHYLQRTCSGTGMGQPTCSYSGLVPTK
jgi:hypothetical protein